jgi:hypothetical protein
MSASDFIQALEAMGHSVTDHENGRVSFPYTVPCGKFADQTITLGFLVPGDFPLTPPSGPHLSPRLLPLNPISGSHPTHGVHESPSFGTGWEYWSRPMNHWPQTNRTARDVMAHVRHLFDTQ